MKYSKLSLGTIEAIVNKLGGMKGVHYLLTGKIILTRPELKLETWKTIRLGTHERIEMIIPELAEKKFGIEESVYEAIDFKQIIVSSMEREIKLIKVSLLDFGLNKSFSYNQICDKAKKIGLELCPQEVGLQLRLQYADQPKKENLIIMSELMNIDFKTNILFRLDFYREVSHISGYHLVPSEPFDFLDEELIFCLP